MNNFDHLVSSIGSLHDSMRRAAVGSVNKILTFRNWPIGRYIVEYEQKGRDRAEYGANLIPRLAQRLNGRRGFSFRNLNLFREFYRVYPQISQLVSAELPVLGIGSEILQLPTAQLQPNKNKEVMSISPKAEQLVRHYETRVKYATAGMDNRLFVSKYQTVLPSEEQIRAFLENDRDRTEHVICEMVTKYKSIKRKT